MSSFNFPIFKTKNVSVSKGFNLADPVERREYFDLKAGEEIKKIRDFLKDKTFVAYLLGKKNSGKGTYTKLFMEAVGSENISHVSVGDIIRAANQDLLDSDKKDAITDFLKANYRGFMPLEKAIEAILSRDTKTLIPTEITLALIKWEISRLNKKAVFLDGFPRDLDQISYALYFRDLINYRNDPDFFVFIDLPEAIINERMKTRVVCPICHTPRTTKLLITKEVGYDKEKKEFYLICDNPECNKARMVAKEGDALGIEAIRGRIQTDDKIMRMLLELNGVPKVFLRNSVPVKLAEDSVDDYEITPAYSFKLTRNYKKLKLLKVLGR